MDIKDLMKDFEHLTDSELKRRLEKLIIENSNYRNLDKNDQKLIFDLILKRRDYIRRGIGISDSEIREEMYKLYQKRLELNLTEKDLKDIKEIMEAFKR